MEIWKQWLKEHYGKYSFSHLYDLHKDITLLTKTSLDFNTFLSLLQEIKEGR